MFLYTSPSDILHTNKTQGIVSNRHFKADNPFFLGVVSNVNGTFTQKCGQNLHRVRSGARGTSITVAISLKLAVPPRNRHQPNDALLQTTSSDVGKTSASIHPWNSDVSGNLKMLREDHTSSGVKIVPPWGLSSSE